MTKKEIVKTISEEIGLTQLKTKEIVQKTFDAISQGAAGSWMLSNRGPQILQRDWRPGFTIDLQQKDIRLILDAADELGVPVPSTAQIFQLYRTLQSQGLGGEGNHALVKALENMTGIQVGQEQV